MKLFGSSSHSKHSGHNDALHTEHIKSSGGKHTSKKKGNIFLRVLIIVLIIAAALAVAGYAYWTTRVKPPEVIRPANDTPKTDITPVNAEPDGSVSPDNPVEENNTDDQKNTENEITKYTFAVVASDDGNGNTDVIMTGTFDVENYTLNVVSIPRDTLVNVSWNLKKANTLYSFGADKENKLNNVKAGIRDLTGYDIDFAVNVNMKAFIKLINGIGGVDFYCPRNMNYDDPYQDLHIHISKGQQHFDGKKALELLRFRSGYSDADIGRIAMQQDFLKTMVKQILSNVDKIPLTTLVDIFVNDVETDLNEGNLIWFAKEFFKMNAENVHFMTIPVKGDDYVYVGGSPVSYPTIYVDEWLEMLNEYLNPLDTEITEKDVDILTKVDGKLYVTSGVKKGDQSWGTGGRKASSSGSNTSSSNTSSNSNTSDNTNNNTNTNTSTNTNTAPSDEPEETLTETPDATETPIDVSSEIIEEPAEQTPETPAEQTPEAPAEPEPQINTQPEQNTTPEPSEAGGEGANE